MRYTEKNGKYIFEQDGVFFAMTLEQVREMGRHCEVILHLDYLKNAKPLPIEDVGGCAGDVIAV